MTLVPILDKSIWTWLLGPPFGHRKRRDGKYRYLVKWRGYSYEESTWEPSSNFKSKTLQAYHRERKERKANESGSSSEDEPTGKTLAVAIGVGAEEAALARHRASVENLPNRDPNRVVAKPSTVETPGETLGETLAHMESSSNSRPGEIGSKRSTKRKASSPNIDTRARARAHACMSADARDVEMLRTVGDSRVHGDSNPLILAFRAVYEAGRGSRTDPPLL